MAARHGARVRDNADQVGPGIGKRLHRLGVVVRAVFENGQSIDRRVCHRVAVQLLPLHHAGHQRKNAKETRADISRAGAVYLLYGPITGSGDMGLASASVLGLPW